MIKAVLCEKHGPPSTLHYTSIPSPKPKKGEVLISVQACGVNFPDTLIIQGKYQFQPELPFSPGGEIAGVVKELGPGVKEVKVGQRVIAMVGWGGFADEVVVGVKRIIELPPQMDPVIGSAFTMTYGTSYHALKDRAQLKHGESILVLGAAGGVGLAAVEIAKVMGAKVIACASSSEKLETCKKYGADVLINYSEKNWDQKLKKEFPNGVDVVYDPVGGDYAEKAMRMMAWKGRYLVVGFAAGSIPSIKLNIYLLKGCEAMGVFWGRFTATEPEQSKENLRQLAQWFTEGKLKPLVSKIFPLSEASQALEDLINRKVQGKVVLTTNNYITTKSKL